MKNYKLSRMNKRCEFGNTVSGSTNSFGQKVNVFKADFTVYCGDYTTSMSQAITLQGLNITDTREIVIRHRDDVINEKLVHLDNVEYNIINVVSDDGINTFDIVTLQKVKGI
ncbi:phage head closure protein [Pediococcus ethanolidurans]|uniref:phage head closure protein n=1 Tax=Pediococcus ethanolidurans TaxID=319653 RepID=UPI001C1F0029|nr:phage head closure protein [Pediococcus ethanolidurans]MBU7563059.1 phage head closure protein [Pediococcus ethanolidurans]